MKSVTKYNKSRELTFPKASGIVFVIAALCAWPNGETQSASTPEFKVHFVVTTPRAGRRASPAALRREVAILNKYFRARDGSAPIRFRFGSATFQPEAKRSSCAALRMLNRPREHSRTWSRAYARCLDVRVRAPNAVNILIHDAWNREKRFGDSTSRGGTAGGLPYVLLDIARLGHRIQSPEEHEMGHAFGLGHVCVSGATIRTNTNIMASREGCDGSGGRRNIGFTARQVRMILSRAERYKQRMATFAPGRLLRNPGFENRNLHWKSSSGKYSTRSKRSGRFAGLVMGGGSLEQSFRTGSSTRVEPVAYIRSRCDAGEMGLRVNGRRASYKLIRGRTRGFRRIDLPSVRIPANTRATIYFKCSRGYLVVDDVSLTTGPR